ncbi:MAG: SusD/RagB family nutrient-binding outer membrane lipoprotein [Bacteroidota bacterium]|nr:SusD/RagB family nutrient-binding outer membrane lipoprotein [Bacteroidota bacterium]
MKNKLKYILSFCLVCILNACDKNFEEVNKNPNVPVTVTPDLLLPTIIREPFNQHFDLAWGYGNIVMQQTAKIQFTNEDRYNWGAQSSPWNTFYDALRDVNKILEITEENGQKNYHGIALIMKSWMYHVLTDAYGDIPYSQSIKAKSDKNYAPEYETQQKVYEGILADLEEANTILGTSDEIVNGDILYGGNINNWKRFANSLRLRIHMRLSDRINPSAAMQAILNNADQNPIFEDLSHQAALQYLPSAPNQHPLYTSRSGSFDEIRLSAKLETTLKELDDPRLKVFAQPTTNSVEAGSPDYAGVPNGLNDEEALQYAPSGDATKGGSNYISRVGLLWACLPCNPEASPTAAQSVAMSYPELLFILAEAAERGFISGDAEMYYIKGIEESFNYYNSRIPANYNLNVIPDASYYTQQEVAFTGTSEEKLQKIGTQKWISLFNNGMESWFDWRRTGIPNIIPGPGNVNNNRVPVRFQYPTEEQALNSESYKAVVARQGEDFINTRVWWDVN